MDTKLLELLVCPVTKGPPGSTNRETAGAASRAVHRLAYPVRDGIPILLENEARPLTEEDSELAPPHCEHCPMSRGFTVLIPARLASSAAAQQATGRHWRRCPWWCVWPNGYAAGSAVPAPALRGRRRLTNRIVQACQDARCRSTSSPEPGPRLPAVIAWPKPAPSLEPAEDDAIVVNVQGDEPLMEPGAGCRRCPASCNGHTRTASMSHRRPHHRPDVADFTQPQCGQGGDWTPLHTALYFSRAPISWWRDGFANGDQRHALPDSRAAAAHWHVYAYRVGFLRQFPMLAPSADGSDSKSLEQLRALWHGHRIAVHVRAPTGAWRRGRHARRFGPRSRPIWGGLTLDHPAPAGAPVSL